METQHQNQVSHLTSTYHFQKNVALHPKSGIYHGEFLLWCKINAQDRQVTETFMTRLAMREGPFIWLHACTNFAFTMLGSTAPIMGLLQYKKCDCEEKARLLIMQTSQGSSWTFRWHGSLGPLDPLGKPLDSWHVGPSWLFWHLCNLDLLTIWTSLGLLAIWISWRSPWILDI